MTENKWLVSGLGIFVILLIGFNGYLLYLLKTMPQIPTPQLPVINIGTDGKPSTASEPRVVYLQGENTHTKEIVVQQAPPGEVAGLKLITKDGKFYADINGKIIEVPVEKSQTEGTAGNQVVITEQSTMRLNITMPKQRFNLGVGWSTNGPALAANGPLTGVVGWWAYGDKKTVAGGIQFPIFK
jgi:hypothetical protein